MTITVTPKQAYDLQEGEARAVVTACAVPDPPPVVTLSCPEIGWQARAEVGVVQVSPRYLMALARKGNTRSIGETKLMIFHMCRYCETVSVFLIWRLENDGVL